MKSIKKFIISSILFIVFIATALADIGDWAISNMPNRDRKGYTIFYNCVPYKSYWDEFGDFDDGLYVGVIRFVNHADCQIQLQICDWDEFGRSDYIVIGNKNSYWPVLKNLNFVWADFYRQMVCPVICEVKAHNVIGCWIDDDVIFEQHQEKNLKVLSPNPTTRFEKLEQG